MAFHYARCDRNQLILMPTSMQDWLEEGHLAWFIIDVVSKVDTSAFHRLHPNDGPGRPAYNPDMMLALLFYAYCMGQRSSRRIERFCITDAAYRVICGNATPDHATIARFLVNHEKAIEDVFVDVLRLCVAAELVSVGTIAIDGTKIGANAALDVNRSGEHIRSEITRILQEALDTDAGEDCEPELFATDTLPSDLATHSGRLARLQSALTRIEEQEAEQQAETQRQEQAAKDAVEQDKKLKGRRPKDPLAALIRAQSDYNIELTRFEDKTRKWEAKAQERESRGKATPGPRPVHDKRVEKAAKVLKQAQECAKAAIAVAVTANTTDPDSRIMKTKDGFIQGYNSQAAVNENQIVIASAVTQQGNDVRQYQPMVATTQSILASVGLSIDDQVVLADAGYWSDENATAPGPDKLIATLKDYKQRRAARDLGTTTGPVPDGLSALDAMEHRLRTPEGSALYATRSHTVEPVFGDHKQNRGFREFRRRGLSAVTSEWALMNTVHNIAKLFSHHTAAGLSTA